MTSVLTSDWDLWTGFAVAGLATWRMTHLVANEDGPGDIIVRLRVWLGYRWVGRLMDCFQCLSFWIAAPLALFISSQPLRWVLSWLGLSGAACLLERLGQQPVMIEPISREAGDAYNVLRPETDGLEESVGSSAKHGSGDSSTRT